MKCLALLVEMDPDILALRDVCVGVNYSFHDQSAAVREAAVDLVGKSVLGQPELIDKYYAVLSDRILVSSLILCLNFIFQNKSTNLLKQNYLCHFFI